MLRYNHKSPFSNFMLMSRTRLAVRRLPPGSGYAEKLLEHSLVTFIHSGLLGLRYVVWLCNKGRKGRGLCLPPVCPYGRLAFCREKSGSYEACSRTFIRRETCCRETDCGEPSCVESREYWPATGAKAALLIWMGARHVVEGNYLFGGLY